MRRNAGRHFVIFMIVLSVIDDNYDTFSDM